jgi:hypothetical protein
MAARPSRNQKRVFEELIASLEPQIRAAFEAAVADLRSGVDWKALLAALSVGDIDAAIAALHIDAAAFQALAASMQGAYMSGGVMAAAAIRGPAAGLIRFRFDMANPVAEAWIKENVGLRITGQMTTETLQAVRDVIQAGYARGEGPLTIALDIAGRSVNGVRQGGILGLDKPRADRLAIVKAGMRTPEGVQGLVVKSADGTLRVKYKVNKATENRILSAYLKGTAVPESQRIISEKQYTSLLLKARADTIARTETGQAVMSARFEAWRQAAEAEGYTVDAILKTWRHGSHSKQARPEHIAMNGTTVRGLYTPFEFKNGVKKMHALDGEGFGRHDINCGCSTDFRLDRSKGLVNG